MDILDAIGNTSLVRLRKVVPANGAALFAGTSSGAHVAAALRVAERLGPHAKVVTLMVDSGLKYVSTDVYRMRRAGAS